VNILLDPRALITALGALLRWDLGQIDCAAGVRWGGIRLLSHNPLLTDTARELLFSLVTRRVYGRLYGFVSDQRNFALLGNQQCRLFTVSDAYRVVLFGRLKLAYLLGQVIEPNGSVF